MNFKRHISAFFCFVTGLCLLSITGCIKPGSADSFVIANGTDSVSLDPTRIENKAGERIYLALFEGLVSYNPRTGSVVPALAEEWKYSDDCTSITFTLRNASWSDGTSITAQTVADSWLHMLEPEHESTYSYMLKELILGANDYSLGLCSKDDVHIHVVDTKTLKVTFISPKADAVEKMYHCGFAVLPMHVISKSADDWAASNTIVCNGPFKVQTIAKDGTITLVTNKKHWNTENTLIRKIVFLRADASEETRQAYDKGKIDWIADIKAENLSLFDNYPISVSPSPIVHYIWFNMNHEILSTPLVRKAISMALDRNDFVTDVLKGKAIPALSLVPPLTNWLPCKTNSSSESQAKKMLEQAGYANGKNFPELTVLYNSESSVNAETAAYISKTLKRVLNISVKLQSTEWSSFLSLRRKNACDLAISGWFCKTDTPSSFLEQLISTDGNNDGRYNNQSFDSIMRHAAQKENQQERYSLLRQAEKIAVTEDQAVIPLYYDVSYNLVHTDKWEGWTANTADIHPYMGLKLLPPKPKTASF